MARMARVVVPRHPHHVTQRGNRRQRTFFTDADYSCYLDLMAEYACAARTEIWAYCLMPNHVHFVMVPEEEDGLRSALSEVHRRYTRRINLRHGWRGHLWQERFHSFVMDEHYLLATVRYVENNPVMARLCTRAGQWRWSSASAHLDGSDNGLVRVQPMLSRVPDWADYLARTEVPRKEVELIQRHSRTGRPLGSRAFIGKMESLTGKPLAPKKPGPAPWKRVK